MTQLPHLQQSPTSRPVIRRKALISAQEQPSQTTQVSSLKPDTNYTVPQDDESSGCIGICAACRRGMQDSELWTLCMFCSVDFCTSCAPFHDSSHERYTIKVSLHTGEPTSDKKCSLCKKECPNGIECTECDEVFCGTCVYENRIEFFRSHPHKRYRCESSQVCLTHTGIRNAQKECDLHKKGVISHCKSCFRGIDHLKEKAYFCVDCPRSPTYCGICAATKRQLEPDHCWISLLYTVRPQEEVLEARKDGLLRCDSCNFKATGSQDAAVKDHEHKDYTFMLWPAHVETLTARFCRECCAKPVRRLTLPAEVNGNECSWCKTPSPHKEFCLKCMQDEGDYDGYCAPCRDEYGDMHRHGKEHFASFKNSIRMYDDRIPSCSIFFDQRTKRRWYVPDQVLPYTFSSFERPMPLMHGWTWYTDDWGEPFIVHAGHGLAVRESFLQIPKSAWQEQQPPLAGWQRVAVDAPVDGYTHEETGIFMQACPVTHSSFALAPLPKGWVLVYDSASNVPRFCPYLKDANTFTANDPRHVKVQWKPRMMAKGWRVVDDEVGRCRFLPPDTKFLKDLPLDENEIDQGQIPVGVDLEYDVVIPATPISSHAVYDATSPSRPSITTPSSSASSTTTMSSLSSNLSTLTARLPKMKLSKRDVARICLQGVSIGVNIGTSFAGTPISLNLASLVPAAPSSDSPAPDSFDAIQDDGTYPST